MTIANHELIALARKSRFRMRRIPREIVYALVGPARNLLQAGHSPDQVLENLEDIAVKMAYLDKLECALREAPWTTLEYDEICHVVSTAALRTALITLLEGEDRPAWHGVYEEALYDPARYLDGNPEPFQCSQDMSDETHLDNAKALLAAWDGTPDGVRQLLTTLAIGLLDIKNECDALLDVAHTLELADFLESTPPEPKEVREGILASPAIRMILAVDAVHHGIVATLSPRLRWLWSDMDPFERVG